MRQYIWLCVCLSLCVPSPEQSKNDIDLKFSTHIPLESLWAASLISHKKIGKLFMKIWNIIMNTSTEGGMD